MKLQSLLASHTYPHSALLFSNTFPPLAMLSMFFSYLSASPKFPSLSTVSAGPRTMLDMQWVLSKLLVSSLTSPVLYQVPRPGP